MFYTPRFPPASPLFPSPTDDPEAWFLLIKHYPQEWCNIVDRYHEHRDDVDAFKHQMCAKRRLSDVGSSVQFSHVCRLCLDPPFAATTARGLSSHMWIKHGVRAPVAAVLGNTTVCPACRTDFFSRVRLLTHAAEKRIRFVTRGKSCSEVIMSMNLPLVPEQELKQLQILEREERHAALRSGQTHPIASKPARRSRPSVLKSRSDVPIRRRLVGKQPPPAVYSANSETFQPSAKKRKVSVF